MKLFNRLFNKRRIGQFDVKLDKSSSEWRVLKAKRLVFVGSQQECQQFVDNNHDAFL